LEDVLDVLKSKTKKMERDRKRLEDNTVPKYEDALSKLPALRESAWGRSSELMSSITKQGQIWHQEVDNIVNHIQAQIEKLTEKQLVILDRYEEELKALISKAKQSAIDLKKALNSKDFSFSFSYESKIIQFDKMYEPPEIKMPTFSPPKINTEELRQMFGSLEGKLKRMYFQGGIHVCRVLYGSQREM
jgi:regulator of replication initiation timing